MQTDSKPNLIDKKRELAKILSMDSDLRQALMEVNKMNMIKASLLVRVPKHRQVNVENILEGQTLQRDLAVGDYIFVQNFANVMQMADNNLKMGNSFNRNLMIQAYRILAEKPEGRLRTSNPVVYSLSHVPPHCADIDKRLSEMFEKMASQELEKNSKLDNEEDFDKIIVAKVMYLHNSILDIWPFEEYNGELAIFAINYCLLENGLMPIEMPIDKREYMEMVTACLKGQMLKEEYAFFMEAITEKMDKTLEVCRNYIS